MEAAKASYCDIEKFTEMAGLQQQIAVVYKSHDRHSVASYLGHPIFFITKVLLTDLTCLKQTISQFSANSSAPLFYITDLTYLT